MYPTELLNRGTHLYEVNQIIRDYNNGDVPSEYASMLIERKISAIGNTLVEDVAHKESLSNVQKSLGKLNEIILKGDKENLDVKLSEYQDSIEAYKIDSERILKETTKVKWYAW